MEKWLSKTYHRNRLEHILQAQSKKLKGKILDIGSKNRRYDNLFLGCEIIAVDKIENREKDVLLGDIEQGLNFEDSYFDGVLCIEVFEYLENHQKAIKEISRLLKPGGVGIVSVPFLYHDHEDKIRFTIDFLTNEFKNYFDVYSIKIGNAFTVVWDVIRKKIYNIKNKFIRLFLLILISPFYLLLKIFRLEKIEDNFYSGIFLFINKPI